MSYQNDNVPLKPKQKCPPRCKIKSLDFLKKAFAVVENKIVADSFDREGNFSFGIKEHIEFPGEKYDSKIGIYGMDVCVSVERPGYRIKRRKRENKSIPSGLRITKDEAIDFVQKMFNVKVSS